MDRRPKQIILLNPMGSPLGFGWIFARVSGVGFSTHCILFDAGASEMETADLRYIQL